MPKTNRRAVTIAAIVAAIVLVAGVAAAFALSVPTSTQQVAGIPPLATGLPLAEQPTSVAVAPSPSTKGGSKAAAAKPSKPAAAPHASQGGTTGTGVTGGSAAGSGAAAPSAGSSKPGGTSTGSTSVSKPSASGSPSSASGHGEADGEHRETVKPRVRDEHSDRHHD
jgi:hypothetical protein